MRSTRFAVALAGVALIAACNEATSPNGIKPLSFDDQYDSEDSVECTVDSTLSVVVSYNGTDYTHTYIITNGTGGSFTGTSTTSPSENVTGTLSGDSFTLNSTYTDGSGYTFSLTGTVDSTGTITGTGTSNQDQNFTFTATNAVSCSSEADCPEAPAVANQYLKELGYKGKKVNGQNIISQIAQMTDEDGTFMNLQPCDSGYVTAVRTWIDQQMGGYTTSSSKNH